MNRELLEKPFAPEQIKQRVKRGGQTLTINKKISFGIWSFMVRPLRTEYPCAWYHVTSRENEKKKIYSDDQDKQGKRRFLRFS